MRNQNPDVGGRAGVIDHQETITASSGIVKPLSGSHRLRQAMYEERERETRKRKASASLGYTQPENPMRKSARMTLAQSSQKDGTHGAAVKFLWASLPTDLQERIMSKLSVRDTARFTSAIDSRDARAIHRGMMHKRHEALRDILRQHFGEKAASLMPPLDMANPGDVYVKGAQVPPLLQLRPHQHDYQEVYLQNAQYELTGRIDTIRGHCQGYFTRSGLEGWGRWDCWHNSQACRRSFVGEWRAGKRHWGTWTTLSGMVYTGDYIDDRLHGPTLAAFRKQKAFECVFKNGRLVSDGNRSRLGRPTRWAHYAW